MIRQALTLAFLALLALTPVGVADEMVPFEARLEGTAAPVFNLDGTINNTENAVGNATHLGLFTWYSQEFAVFTGPGQLHVCGCFVMTAANGDEVYGTYETDGFADANGFGHFEGPYVVTGGTGRFANATGSGTLQGLGRLGPPFEIVGSLSGTISQPNN